MRRVQERWTAFGFRPSMQGRIANKERSRADRLHILLTRHGDGSSQELRRCPFSKPEFFPCHHVWRRLMLISSMYAQPPIHSPISTASVESLRVCTHMGSIQTHRYQNSKISIQGMICSTSGSIMARSMRDELGECYLLAGLADLPSITRSQNSQ